MKKKFDSLYAESKDLHKDINNLVKTMLVENEDELNNMDVDDIALILKVSSITKKTLDLMDKTCKSLDDINDKLDKLDKKLDNN